MTRARLPVPAALFALALLAAPAVALEGGPRPAPVRVQPVVKERLQNRRAVTGSIRAARRSLVASEESGRVVEAPPLVGRRAEKGAVLARIDDERLRLEKARSEADIARIEAELVEQRVELERRRRDRDTLRELAARDAANPKELADAVSDVATQEARLGAIERRVEVARADLRLVERRLADTVVRAPFTGTVLARHVETGAWLGAGDPVVELVAADELEAWIEVPQTAWAVLRVVEGSFDLTVDATDRVITITDWRPVPQVDREARTFLIAAPLPDPAGLAPGMSVTARVPTGAEAEHLLVSRDALMRNEVGFFVYVAAGGGEGGAAKAMPVPVEVLFGVGDRAVVRSPALQAGASVVVEGNERLYPGQSVQPMAAGAGEGE